MEEYISDNSLYIRSKNNSMINRKMIGRVLGMLLFIELGMFLLCAGVSAGYGESDYKCCGRRIVTALRTGSGE